MARHNKSKQLSNAEITAILKAAEPLHNALVRPSISPQCEHYKATTKLTSAIFAAIKELTGHDTPPWMTYGTTTPSRWSQGLDY